MSCEVVIANKLFGAYQGGRYAAAIQWLLLLRNANMALVVLCVPTILRLVGEHKHDELIAYTRQAMTWSALFIALPAGFVCGVSPVLLTAWLGPHFTDLWPLVVVQLTPMVFTCTVLPLYSISLGTDKMLVGGIAQLVLGAVGVVIGILLGWQWGMIGVAIGVNWSFGIKELVFTPAYAAHNIGAQPRTFLAPLGTVALLFCVAMGLSWVGVQLCGPHSMIQLFYLGVGVGLVYATICFVAFRSLIMDAITTLSAKRGHTAGPAVQEG
jgi:membrane protein EpsK